MITTCVDCGRKLYRISVPRHARPKGSVKHAALGRCARDLERLRKRAREAAPERPVARLDAAQALDLYLRGRERRAAERAARERRLAAARDAGLIPA